MRFNPAILETEAPPLVGLMARARALTEDGADVINLCQATIDLPPPRSFVDAVAEALARPETHGYAPDQGLLELRAALAAYAERSFGVRWDPETEIMVTAGANLACYAALSVLARPGDEVLIPSPWYFNHAMTLTMLGAKPMAVPGRPEKGLVPEQAALDAAVSERTRGLVLVNPNNPTGARYRDSLVDYLSVVAKDNDLWMLSDQTYQEIHFGLDRPVSAASMDELRDRTATAGSFSKSLGLAGWRIGFLAGPAELIEQVLKIQDCTAICAPRVAQIGLLAALPDIEAHTEMVRGTLRERREWLLGSLNSAGITLFTEPGGACFLFLRLPEGTDDRQFCASLLEQMHVAAVPGSAFGPGGEGHVRISFGACESSRLAEAAKRLARFLESSDS